MKKSYLIYKYCAVQLVTMDVMRRYATMQLVTMDVHDELQRSPRECCESARPGIEETPVHAETN